MFSINIYTCYTRPFTVEARLLKKIASLWGADHYKDVVAEPMTDSAVVIEKPKPSRLDSIDFLRGLVMILMALDHVRDFFSDRLFLDATDLTTTTPANFLTRWVTH